MLHIGVMFIKGLYETRLKFPKKQIEKKNQNKQIKQQKQQHNKTSYWMSWMHFEKFIQSELNFLRSCIVFQIAFSGFKIWTLYDFFEKFIILKLFLQWTFQEVLICRLTRNSVALRPMYNVQVLDRT